MVFLIYEYYRLICRMYLLMSICIDPTNFLTAVSKFVVKFSIESFSKTIIILHILRRAEFSVVANVQMNRVQLKLIIPGKKWSYVIQNKSILKLIIQGWASYCRISPGICSLRDLHVCLMLASIFSHFVLCRCKTFNL